MFKKINKSKSLGNRIYKLFGKKKKFILNYLAKKKNYSEFFDKKFYYLNEVI